MTEDQCKLIEFVGIARRHEELKQLGERNIVARKIFRCRRWRKVMITPDRQIETWWDRHSLNYITQTLDADNLEVGIIPSNYTGNAADAAVAHFWALHNALNAEEQKRLAVSR